MPSCVRVSAHVRYVVYRSKKRNLENIAGGDVELTEDDLKEINEILAKPVKGGRYNDAVDPKVLGLWA